MSREVIKKMIDKIRRGPVESYFTGGLCVVHVEDVVQGALAALASGKTGERYILGGENLSYRDRADRAVRAMRMRRCFVRVGPLVTGTAALALEARGRLRGQRPRITFVTHYCASRYSFFSWSKAGKTLGHTPRGFDAILQESLSRL